MDNIAEKVELIFNDCLFKSNEIVDGKPIVEPLAVEGICGKFGFNPYRVENHTEEIKKILNEMPDEFHAGKGGGMSFLNMCNDKNGHQWGEQTNMEQLVVLGIATGMVKYGMLRDMWHVLTGGMTYIIINI